MQSVASSALVVHGAKDSFCNIEVTVTDKFSQELLMLEGENVELTKIIQQIQQHKIQLNWFDKSYSDVLNKLPKLMKNSQSLVVTKNISDSLVIEEE